MQVQVADEEGDPPPLWLGLDLSTQSLTAAVLQGDGVGGVFNEPIVLESANYEVNCCMSHTHNAVQCFCILWRKLHALVR